jgi:fibronectin type 3 domain-containing protein
MLGILLLMLQDAQMAGATTPEGVVLRWAVMEGELPKDGYELWRREGSGEPSRVATVSPMKAEDIRKAYGQDMALAVETFLTDKGEDLDIRRAFVAFLCETNVHYAKALGWYYLDASAAKGKKFTYELRVGGAVWARSKEVEAGGEAVVSVPKKPEIQIDGTTVVVMWEKLPNLSGYYIYRAEGQGKLERLNAEAVGVMDPPEEKKDQKPAFADTTAKDGVAYSYAVSAVDAFGRESKPSERAELRMRDIVSPPYPTMVEAKEKDGKMTVTWKAVEASDLAGYHVYRTPSVDVAPTKLNKEPISSSSYVDEDLKSGGALYIITAVDKAGNESSQSTPGYGRFKDLIPPAKVAGLKTFPERGKITVAWDPVPDKDLARYVVFRSSDVHPEWIRISDVSKETRFVDHLAESLAETFRYRVRAIDSSDNEGPESDVVQARLPDVTAPPAPILIRAVGENQGVKIVWQTRGADIEGVFVERADKPKGPWKRLNKEPLKGSEYKDESSQAAWYTVLAVDKAGNVSERSNASSGAGVDQTPPAKVTGVAAGQEKSAVKVSWNASRDGDLAGYVVERKSDGGEWRQVGPLLSETGYLDRAVRAGLKYSYRVVAFDVGGNRSESSDVSVVEVKP